MLDVLPNTILHGTRVDTPVMLTFPKFIADLHDTILFCGTSINRKLAQFYLKKFGRYTGLTIV